MLQNNSTEKHAVVNIDGRRVDALSTALDLVEETAAELVEVETVRLETLSRALDAILFDGPNHLYREECPCRWCYRQRGLRPASALRNSGAAA